MTEVWCRLQGDFHTYLSYMVGYSIVGSGSPSVIYVEANGCNIKPGDYYESDGYRGFVDFKLRTGATFGEIDIDSPYKDGEAIPLIYGSSDYEILLVIKTPRGYCWAIFPTHGLGFDTR